MAQIQSSNNIQHIIKASFNTPNNVKSSFNKVVSISRGQILSPYILGAILETISILLMTSEEDAIANDLPAQIEVDLSDGNTITIDVSWNTENYVYNERGTYEFIAEYNIPEYLFQLKPTIVQEVVVEGIFDNTFSNVFK